jgi:uncharacterized repeat protein (TIGR02543 family)
MRKLLVPIVTVSVLLLASISTPAQAATYNGTSGTVNCSDSGFFTITDNVVVRDNVCSGDAVIPAGVTSIGDSAFYEQNLKDVTFEADSKLVSIGNSSFDQSSLASIAIPDSVTTIVESAFRDTRSLAAVTFGPASKLISIEDSAFSRSSVPSIAIPDSVKTIFPNAFSEAASLKTVTFGPDSQLVSIGGNAFNGASALTSITIPAGVSSIWDDTFKGASALNSVFFFGQAPSVVDSAFSGISADAYAYIKSGATGFADVGFLWKGLTVAVGVYSLDYDSNDGSAVSSRLFVTGDSVSAPTQPTKSGNTFAGWSATDGGSILTFPYSPSQTADVVLYALWTAIAVPSSPTPATNYDEEAVASEEELASRTVSAKKKYSLKSLSKRLGVIAISEKAKISFKVAKGSKKICTVSGTKLTTLKAGTCKVTFIVQEPKTKNGKKPKATRTVKVLVVNKKVSLA